MVIPPSSPLVTREALQAFTRQLVERFAPEQIILFGSRARGDGRWDSDADILVVMPFRGRHLAQIRAMRKACPASFPLDLLGGERFCMAEAWSAVPEQFCGG